MAAKLTKRNQDFVFHLEKLLKDEATFDNDKSSTIISDVENQLSEGQKSGKTARQLFGTPSEYLNDLKDPKAAAERKKMAAQKNSNQTMDTSRYGDPKGPGLFDFSFLDEFVDTSLWVFVLFSIIYSVFGLFINSNSQNASGNLGIVTIILISIYGGFLYVYALRRLIFDPQVSERPMSFGRRIIYLIAIVVLWVIGFMALSIIPKQINPILPPIFCLIIGGIGYLIIRFWRQKTGLPSTWLAVTVLTRNSGARGRQAIARNSKNKK